MISRLYAVVLMLAATSTLTGCEEEERQEESSRIKPLAPLVSGLESIKLVSPANGSGFTVFDGSTEPLTFRYEADRPFFGALFLFRGMPTATDGALADIAESCIGGVTDMAPSHNWDPWGATLHPQTENSELYRCYGADPMEPLSLEEKLALTEEDFVPGSTIYWAVLGYSAHYRLTHSSPVYRLVIE